MIVLGVVIVMTAAFTSSDTLHRGLAQILGLSREVMVAYPTTGKVVFVLLSIVSAAAAFFSSAIVVPIAVYAWGSSTTFLLLWAAWLAGGACSYLIGRTVGRSLAGWLAPRERVDYYAAKLSSRASFATILLFQLALPSEVPGYVLGAVRYRFLGYFAALALAELPFALGAVYLGESFIRRDLPLVAGIGVAGLLLTLLAVRALRRRFAVD